MSAFGLHEFSVAQKISMCEYIYIYIIYEEGEELGVVMRMERRHVE